MIREMGPLRRMGLNESAYFLSSFASIILISALSALCLTLGAYISGEFLRSTFFSSVDKFVLFLVTFDYAISLSAFGLLIVAFFSRELYLGLAQGICFC
jgi:hypothetical protein